MVQSGWMRSVAEGFSGGGLRKGIWCLSLLSVLAAPLLQAAEEEPADGEEAQQEPAKPKEPPKPYVVPDSERTRFEFLARSADPREVMTLTTANGEQVLALYRPEHTSKAQGILIILHEEDGHPDWPMVVNPVRTQMPDFGWATLSVAIPSPGAADVPERTLPAVEILAGMPKKEGEEEEAADKKPEGEEAASEDAPAEEASAGKPTTPPDEEGDELGKGDGETAGNPDWPPAKPTFLPVEDKGPLADRIDARIEAAIQQALSKNYEQIVLVGHGVGAGWVLDYLKDHPAPQEQAVVMIQARLPNKNIGVDLSALLLEQQRPILDLYYDDKRFARESADDRANFARRSGNPFYRQTRLGGTGMQSGQTEAKDRRIVQSLRGWLDYLYQPEADKREPADSYIRGPIRSMYEERMERPRY